MYGLAQSVMNFSKLGTGILAFEGSTLSSETFSGIMQALTSQIQVSTIVGVIAAVLGVTVGFAFMWWGGKYAVRKIWGAIKKGKASV